MLSTGPCQVQKYSFRLGDLESDRILYAKWKSATGREHRWTTVSSFDSTQPAGCVWLPDALGGVDDGLHYVVSDEQPVLVGDVIDSRSLCGCTVAITPVLGYHVLKVNHT